MITIKPGSSPTIVFKIPNVDVEHCKNVEIIIKQYPVQVTKYLDDAVIDGNNVCVQLSEIETLIFRPNEPCYAEMKFITEDGSIVLSDKRRVSVLESSGLGTVFEEKFRFNSDNESEIESDDDLMDAYVHTSDAVITTPYDYETLRNKPKIEGNELIGDQTFDELGLSPIPDEEIEPLANG